MKKNFTKQDFYDLLKLGGPNGDCLEWTLGHAAFGYGYTEVDGVSMGCHRLALILEGLNITGKVVMHICDNPPCCNPKHLQIGTKKDNNADRAAKGGYFKGIKNHAAKITEQDVRDIRQLAQNGNTISVLATSYNLSGNHIRRIVYRKNWRHI